MRAIGFSTGAIAKGDFRKALEDLRFVPIDAIELSALRREELPSLLDALDSLDLRQFRHVAVHAPSKFDSRDETAILHGLHGCILRGWSVVAHPDAIRDFSGWAELGSALCIENMDRRKPVGRTAEELDRVFELLPLAGLCLDVAHARHMDATLTCAVELVRRHGHRIRQLHVSEVAVDSRHVPMSFGALSALQEIGRLLPSEVPVIIESPVSGAALLREALLTVNSLAWYSGNPHSEWTRFTEWQRHLSAIGRLAEVLQEHRRLSNSIGIVSAWESLAVLYRVIGEATAFASDEKYREMLNTQRRIHEVLEEHRQLRNEIVHRVPSYMAATRHERDADLDAKGLRMKSLDRDLEGIEKALVRIRRG